MSTSMMMLFEALMVICFGISWPTAIIKTIRSKTVAGISPVFLFFVFSGYGSGILFKVAEYRLTGFINPVIALYCINFCMLGFEIILYFRYREKPKNI